MKRNFLIILIISIISTFIIYNIKHQNNYNILSIGINNNMKYNSYIDYLDVKETTEIVEYYENEMRIKDLITIIEKNKEINRRHIKEIISNSDLIILNILQNDIYLENNSKESLNELTELINNIKKINDKNIVIIGIYNSNGIDKNYKKVNIVDFNYNELAEKMNIDYIKINNIFSSSKDFLSKGKLNTKSHKYIALQINNKYLKNT